MKYKFESEKDIWQAIGVEDSQALLYIYDNHFKVWISWMTQRGGHVNDGEDIFQEALIVLIDKAKDKSFTLTAQVSTLLITICKRLWYKKAAKTKTYFEINDDIDYEDDDILDNHHDREIQFRQMNEALEKLGDPCASILKSYYILNKSMAEIASEFNYTNPDNAKTQKYKCLNRLKKLFFNQKEKLDQNIYKN